MTNHTTRFAPSPSGYLHLGHAFSALFSAEKGKRFILRIEDIDLGRCKPEFTQAIFEDLHWLGLSWEEPVRIQSEHMNDYKSTLQKLEDQGLLYPCFCTRKDIQQEIAQITNAPHGPDGVHYPGTCRSLSKEQQADLIAKGRPYALRLNMEKAIARCPTLFWLDHDQGQQKATPEIFGDVVLARKDTPTSYHLSVCLDDHLQGITLVTRGKDLFHATHIHRLLQELLELNVPEYHHHRLLTDKEGRRYAKRDKSLTLRSLRESGHSVGDVLGMLRP